MGILFIDLGEVRTFEVDDNGSARTIGRDSHNDIVIVHPTVSRHHARIESRDGQFLLTDFNSRNGTRVNGKPVADREELADGARMRIGHVRAWFFTRMPAKLPRSITNRDRGIIFNCACGQRLWSAGDTAGMSVTCGGCNQPVSVPDESDKAEDSAGTVAGVVVAEAEGPKGPVCNVCQWPVERTERKHKCPACGLDFHLDCWRENRGCSAYGCSQVNALVPRPAFQSPAVEDAEPEEPSPADTAMMPSPVAAPGVAWAHALLALAVVGSILGTLSFGIPPAIVALVALVRLLISRTDSKVVLFAALLIAALGAGAGYLISQFWWLGRPLFEFFG